MNIQIQLLLTFRKELQQVYNENKSKEDYLKLLYSTPAGLKMTGRISTNYLQLMNI